ncbi:MAG TPA: beta-propeller fold lactonase family protein [Solirubrobacteraceae bacterium]|nr:beta-propeller fold lactonase family protein [Solirubrobacteraceae bacterium]
MPPRRGRFVLGATVALAFLGVPAAGAMADPGALYTQTNDPAGNVVQAFDRDARGALEPAGTFPTGGAGLASLGGRQGAVELSDDESTVYAVNAGSDTVAALAVTRDGLALVDVAGSGGVAPASVDEDHGRVYVLNSGGTPNVTAFRARRDGSLEPIGSRSLPGALGAAQVTVAPGGSALVVSERLSNRLETLPLDAGGRPGAPVITASSGAVPFGFAFGHRDDVVVSEAGASTVSSYRLGHSGLDTITASLPVGFGAPCWVAVSPNGKLAYTGNGSGSISGFAIGRDGELSPIGTTPTPSPRDLDFSRNGRFLYAVSPTGRVTGYRVGSDGSLELVTSVPAAAGITGAAAG